MSKPFIVYSNKRNKHVAIHTDKCGYPYMHGGKDQHGNGWYEEFGDYKSARHYADTQAAKLRVQATDCSACKPRD